jgi:hypothetical protein
MLTDEPPLPQLEPEFRTFYESGETEEKGTARHLASLLQGPNHGTICSCAFDRCSGSIVETYELKITGSELR